MKKSNIEIIGSGSEGTLGAFRVICIDGGIIEKGTFILPMRNIGSSRLFPEMRGCGARISNHINSIIEMIDFLQSFHPKIWEIEEFEDNDFCKIITPDGTKSVRILGGIQSKHQVLIDKLLILVDELPILEDEMENLIDEILELSKEVNKIYEEREILFTDINGYKEELEELESSSKEAHYEK